MGVSDRVYHLNSWLFWNGLFGSVVIHWNHVNSLNQWLPARWLELVAWNFATKITPFGDCQIMRLLFKRIFMRKSALPENWQKSNNYNLGPQIKALAYPPTLMPFNPELGSSSWWFNILNVPVVTMHHVLQETRFFANVRLHQWEFQEPKMEVLYHIRPYFMGMFPYIGLI